MKKDQGSLMRIFPGIFTIAAVSVMLVFYIGWMANVTKKDEVRQTGRACMLAMETEGYLTGSLENSLRAELSAKGMENIDLTGTTMSDAGYGNAIFLCIRGDLKIHSYTTTRLFRLNKNGTTIPVQLTLESTAKN